MYPLDVVKTRFQLQNNTTGKAEYKSIVDCFQKIVKQEGFSRLYRGILPPVLVEAPKRAIKFGANEQYGQLYKRLFNQDKPTQALSVLTGVSAGVTEAFVVVSFELVKIRLQDKENGGKYSGTMDCVRKIYQQEGIMAFTKGLEATLWRHASWNGAYFGVIHKIRQMLPTADTKQGVLFNNFVAGAIGGSLATALNTPFDVAKTRIQNQSVPPFKYGWTIPSCALIAREEGIRALYKGFVPKVLRLGPGGGILLVVFDYVSNFIRHNLI